MEHPFAGWIDAVKKQFWTAGLLMLAVSKAAAQDGFATMNGFCTGGAGGATVTVTNGSDFILYATLNTTNIVQVQGPITIGSVNVKSHKTIIGLGTNATILGRLNISGVSNVIVQNLRITNPGDDGISIRDGANHVWVDHCTFYDCGDGCCDVTVRADYVTVSWCKFFYTTNQLQHRFTFLVGASETEVDDDGKLHITLHHNWWTSRADQRMAAVRRGQIHYYNNYFNCSNNLYCSNARTNAQFLSESNYYAGVRSPIYKESNGRIKTAGNIYIGTTGNAPDAGTDTVFTPPYTYAPDPAANVPSLVTNGTGAPGPDLVTIPPKIWDGTGSGNNLSTHANWALNENPKEYDTLLFAGINKLTPNNDLSAGNEYPAINFSNNAGAFVLGGNSIGLGNGITSDSVNTQTVNLPINFSYATEHFTTNRIFTVSSNAGALVINGNLAGPTPTYTTNVVGMVTNIITNYVAYAMIKQGPGMLALNGISSWYGPFSINGGTVRFGTLTPNGAGGLGLGTNLIFNNGALQWRTNNSADISIRLVTINSGGATFDVGTNDVSFDKRIGNNGSGALTKLGTGTLTFNATNNYRGDTFITRGVLALGLNGLLTNSPQIILSNNATLDVSARSDGTLTLLSNRMLIGTGSVRGSVIAANGATIAPGFSIGILTITNTLTFQSGGTNLMELNQTAATNDLITGMTSVTYSGQLIITNLNGTLAAGDTFKLFNAGSYHGAFTSISLPPLGGNLYWTNKLATDGTLGVIAPVNTTPTNITVTVVGTTLQVTWPADHTGWWLETQTNTLSVGLHTNWFTVSGSAATNQLWLPIDPANGSVFLRLVYP